MVAISCPFQSPHPATCPVAQNLPLSTVMCHHEKALRRQPAPPHMLLPLLHLPHSRHLPDGLVATCHAICSRLAGAPALPPECSSCTALELLASLQCPARDCSLHHHHDVALQHFSGFFLLHSQEHSEMAESLMLLQNRRGGSFSFLDMRNPETQEWESGLQAMQNSLHLEKCVNLSLLNLTQMATDSSDADLCHFLGTGYLDQQAKFIKDLGDHVSILSNKGSLEGGLADFIFDKLTLGDNDKEE
ncbi:ferritin heavy chain-like [Moschus berezovskii]|uniref:ferritin heavy chain-like n=1 Tax=Moschus berezovskii TaxID=68408 RepID=UPI002443E8CB|nr:ferritin heavy chain-like [Moschus berezovskii]